MSGPLLSPRLAAGAFRPGSERLCAMDLLCSMLGEPLSGFPSCSARPLARMVQAVNDGAAEASGILGEEAGRRVFDLALSTVGTGELDDRSAAAWMADVLGAPWGRFTWGGRHPGALPTGLRVAAAASVLVYALMAVIALDRAGTTALLPAPFSAVGIWVVLGFLVLNVIPNAISPSPPERFTMTPILLVMAVLTLLIALG